MQRTMNESTRQLPAAAEGANWERRLTHIVETMREMSRQTDPQAMVRAYIERMERLQPGRLVSLSRRGLQDPYYRITRSSIWKESVNPWTQRDKLPLLAGGLFGELIYGNEPRIIDELNVEPHDPAVAYFEGQRSLVAIPQFDGGAALNMVIRMRPELSAFDREQLPEMVWMSNLFGRATHNLVLSEELKRAYEAVDHEMKVVAQIQRSLLPRQLPEISTMRFAAYYETSQRAGGDYYDFFPLPDGRWGIFIADVSGHGTPAAVVMAILHSIVHTYPAPPQNPGEFLSHINRQLLEYYTSDNSTFITAFYAIYDPQRRHLTYVSAGHNPPRIKHCALGRISELSCAQTLPLGITAEFEFRSHAVTLAPGDQIILYTDGITEAANPPGDQFGVERLDEILEDCSQSAEELIAAVLAAVREFTAGEPATDDRTLLVGKIS